MTIDLLKARNVQYYPKPVNTTPVRKYDVSIYNIYTYITNPSCYGADTDQLRRLTDRKERKAFKEKYFDYALFSGLFDSRSDSGLRMHSGYICLDFDHMPDRLDKLRQQLISDPCLETALLFTSPSGDGLKWVANINTQLYGHRIWFYGIDQYLWETYGVRTDRSCVNESRACLLCHDPNAYINPVINTITHPSKTEENGE